MTETPNPQSTGQRIFFSGVLLGLLLLLAFFPRLSIPLATAYVSSLAFRPVRAFYLASSTAGRIMLLLTAGVLSVMLFYPLVLVASSLPQELSEFANNLPRLEFLLRAKFSELQAFLLNRFHFHFEFDPVDLVANKIRKSGNAALVIVPQLMGSFLEWALLTPLFGWFLVKEGGRLKEGFLGLIPNTWFERSYMLLHQFNGKFGDYIIAKTIEATILGTIVTFGLWFIGFPYATLLGIVAGVTNILPYVGPVVGWVPALLVGLLQPSGDANVVGMNIVFIAANLVDMALVFPLLVSKIVNLHPLVVVSSVVVGSQIGGVVGMLISVPVVAFIKLLLVEFHRSFYPESLS